MAHIQKDDAARHDAEQQVDMNEKTGVQVVTEKQPSSEVSSGPPSDGPAPVPLSWKLASVLLVTLICFGSKWSSGITAAMKTTMKKELKINNTQFALLEASEDFMTTCLILVSGLVTDRIGGASMYSMNWSIQRFTPIDRLTLCVKGPFCTETRFTPSVPSSWQALRSPARTSS